MNTAPSTAAHASKRARVGLLLVVLVSAAASISLILQHSERRRSTLSNEQIAAFLHDDADPDGIQYALLQIRHRLEKGEGVGVWTAELLRLANHPAENVRYSVAGLMAADPSRPEFHQVLLDMLRYQTVLVRNQAALSLAAFDDPAGREQVMSMLQPVRIYAPRPGHVETVAGAGERVAHGGMIVHLHTGNTVVEVLSPISGRVRSLAVQDGDIVPGGTWIAVVEPGTDQLLAALSALEKIGKPQDLPVLAQVEHNPELPVEVRQQATRTEEKIKQRTQ
jgi:biotin carboxyl carrier protein